MFVLRFLTDLMNPVSSDRGSVEFQPYGKLKYKKREGGWFGTLDGIVPGNRVEIFIEGNRNEIQSYKFEMMSEFVANLDSLLERLFGHIHQNFLDTKWERNIDELLEMYFLAAISLKGDGEGFWVVLEPSFDVDSIFDLFIRFTIVKDEIIWSNISKRTK